MRGVVLAGCLVLSGQAVSSYPDTLTVQPTEDLHVSPPAGPGQRLAVVVPVYRGDLSRAVLSLDRWPSTCSPLTEKNADLVLYCAEGEEDAPAATAAVDTINETAGRCFAKTRLVYAHLSDEEDVYPKGPSVMFFKMFLDEGVHSALSEYDALAIVEWDVLVASDRSFEELHHAAFRRNEDFWVKGSNLGGTNFHLTAQESDMWNMLGHINGNAIYNNNDPEFVEYVDYTRTRWNYTYPYDVALWLTISDFPYSWPLWQRYSSKFVTTNLISYVGFEHVDHTTVSDAIAGQTLFIHGSRVDKGNLAFLEATKHERKKQAYASGYRLSDDSDNHPAACSAACGTVDTAGLPVGTSTVCDDTCAGDSVRFGGYLCGAGDAGHFGNLCRLCYIDIEEARREEQSLALARSDLYGKQQALHVIMCDTMRPPDAAECGDKCGLKQDTVCDESCGTGRHGDYHCNWRDYGATCRFCFHDLETALLADTAAIRHGGRVIMCSTLEPPHNQEKTAREGVQKQSRWRRSSQSRKLQAWQGSNKWKSGSKWQGDADNDISPKWRNKWNIDDDTPTWRPSDDSIGDDFNDDDEGPKWKQDEKWKDNFCDEDGCPHTNANGYRGRVCDESCSDGDPYGTNGCSARDGAYGEYCRVCYIDYDRALANDDPDDRAIMCDTVMPVDAFESSSRRLAASVEKSPPGTGYTLKAWRHGTAVKDGVQYMSRHKQKRKRRKLQDWSDNAKWQTTGKWQGDVDNDEVPKWQQGDSDDDIPTFQRNGRWRGDDKEPKWKETEKWKNNFCDEDDCPTTYANERTGRVCDETCSDGDPYGTNGCGAVDGAFGDYCRTCYFDRDTAWDNDDADDRAIMCSTVLPVMASEASSTRRLTASAKKGIPRVLPLVTAEVEDAQSMFADATALPYVNDLVRGNLCAFIAGHLNETDQIEVAVISVLQFLPGMTVAVAVDKDGCDAYERAIGGLPGVTVHATEDPFTASLFADEFCGVDTSLIFYMQHGSIVSRQFTSKDTHSTHGDLLVVHGSAKLRHIDRELAKQTTKVLGFESPSFTFNTDLFLPVGANADLRNVLVSGRDPDHQERDGDWATREIMDGFAKLRDMPAIPQVMAALAYSKNTPGVWFVDPQTWVSQHLFRTASIWEIPLVKPRYTCSIDQSALQSDAEDIDVGKILQSNLDFFTHGGTCDGGYVNIRVGD